jgi:hypothetical protein
LLRMKYPNMPRRPPIVPEFASSKVFDW